MKWSSTQITSLVLLFALAMSCANGAFVINKTNKSGVAQTIKKELIFDKITLGKPREYIPPKEFELQVGGCVVPIKASISSADPSIIQFNVYDENGRGPTINYLARIEVTEDGVTFYGYGSHTIPNCPVTFDSVGKEAAGGEDTKYRVNVTLSGEDLPPGLALSASKAEGFKDVKAAGLSLKIIIVIVVVCALFVVASIVIGIVVFCMRRKKRVAQNELKTAEEGGKKTEPLEPPSKVTEPPSKVTEPPSKVTEPPSKVPEQPSKVAEPPNKVAPVATQPDVKPVEKKDDKSKKIVEAKKQDENKKADKSSATKKAKSEQKGSVNKKHEEDKKKEDLKLVALDPVPLVYKREGIPSDEICFPEEMPLN